MCFTIVCVADVEVRSRRNEVGKVWGGRNKLNVSLLRMNAKRLCEEVILSTSLYGTEGY